MKTKQTFKRIEDIVIAAGSMFKPPERLTVSQAAAKYRYLRNAGAYQGPWLNTKTPYMNEPMDVLDSREFDGCVFVGPAQSGKALDLNTPIETPSGWTTMGALQKGDWVLGQDGEPVKVVFATETLFNRPCFSVQFEDGVKPVVADVDHQWVVEGVEGTLTTEQLTPGQRITRKGDRYREFVIRKVERVASRPVRCIQVDSYSRMYLCGEDSIPTHNTDALLLNWITYGVTCDPMDMIIYSPTTAAARDFSVRRVDRLNRHSPKVGEKLLKRRDSDNKFDKHYTNGMMLNLSWPSVTEMAGKPVPRVALTDYDRMDDDIDGDGSPFDLASKRTTTFGSFKMALAESSPSKPIINTRWIPSTPHEAPPANGILALYNRGDRRCWYWPCPHCDQYFEGKFEHLEWDGTGDPLTSSETVRMKCPHCGEAIHPDERHDMQQWGMWVKDGQGIDPEGRRFGAGRRTSIASFWLRGVAASFVTWKRLVEVFLLAEEEYAKTGSEEALKKFYNTDLGEAYLPKAVDSDRLPEHLKARAERYADLEDDEAKVVPFNTRMLVATVDVQKNMFVVQVHAILPGVPFDIALVDRFQIRHSHRHDEETGEILWVKPATYLEDWDTIIEEVMDKTYPLADGSGRHMAIKLTVCDSGGYSKNKGESVTSMAYSFYRRLRDEGQHGRFHLVKGDPSPGIPRARVTFPDASSKDRWSAARGDVPVLMLNSNVLKDALHARLDCIQPGKGMFRFPNWLADWWYQEMCSEFRTPKGWEKYAHARNEAWDLSYYCIGACISKLINVEGIDWANPPAWADEWDRNILISQPNEAKKFAESVNNTYDFGKYASALA